MSNQQDELSIPSIPLDKLDCEGDEDCDETPTWGADADGMIPTFVCDDHKDIFPEETLTSLTEAENDEQ